MDFKKLGLLILMLLVATIAKAANYYWVGNSTGTAYWDQVENWKVDGMPASSIPSSSDDIFLDKAGTYTIYFRTNVSCRNFTVLGGSPILRASSGTLYLYTYGSVSMNTTIRSHDNSVRFHLKSNSIATYKSNGAPLWVHMIVDKEGGELTILDDLKYQYLDYFAGKLTFAPGITVNLDYFRSNSVDNLLRTLELGNAYITVTTDWLYTGANAQLDAGTSHIEMKRADGTRFYVEAVASHTYNKFSFTNTLATIYNTRSDTKGLSAKEVQYTVANRYGTNMLRLVGVAGDSVRIGSLKTNSRVDFDFAVVDDAEYKTMYSTFVGARSRIEKLIIEGSGHFQDNIKINTLAISYGQYYSFNQNQKYQIFDDFSILGNPCNGFITFECGNANVANMAEFVKTSGSLDILYGYIRNIKTSGGAVFNCTGYNLHGTSIGWNFTDYVATGKDLYWIGGGGYTYWNTPEAWSLTSGGAPANCVPSQHDNVFFDNNSGLTTADKNVKLRGGIRAISKDLNFIGDPEYLPRLDIRDSRGFDIYGSLVLNLGVGFANTQDIDSLRFLSSVPGNTITSNGVTSIRMSFNNPTGEWTFMDDLAVSGKMILNQGKWTLMGNLTTTDDIVFNQGTLNTNSKNMSFRQFYSTNNGVRNLILGSSVLTPTIGGNNQWGWYYNGTNLTLDAGTSLINLVHSSIVSDTLLLYNKIKISEVGNNQSTIQTIKAKHVELIQNPLNTGLTVLFKGYTIIDSLVSNRITEFYGVAKIKNAQLFHNGYFRTSNFFDTLQLAGDNFIYYFGQATTQDISSKITTLATGCNGLIALQNITNPPTGTAKIKIPAAETFHINGARIRGMEGVDGTFTASGEDEGSNINWVFTPPVSKDIYWVGGSGNWHDQAHWSGTSGGAGGFCLPTVYDNVFFDLNSNLIPTDSLNVYAPNAKNAFCKNMTWSGVQGVYEKLHIENSLIVYGSIDLQADVNYLVRHFRFWAYDNFAVETVKTNGAKITGYAIFGEVNREQYGSWKLLDKLNMGYGTIKINNVTYPLTGHIQVYGTFDTDRHDIFAHRYISYSKSVSYWRNSTVEINHRPIGSGLDETVIGVINATAKLYADSATLLVDQRYGHPVNIRLSGVTIKKISVEEGTTSPDLNFYGGGTVGYLNAQSTCNTHIREGITAKRVDAHKGMRFHQYATIDTFNVGTGDYIFTNGKTYNFGIIQDFPLMCVSQRGFNAQNAKINVAERFSLTNTDFTNTNIAGINTPFSVTGTSIGTNTGLNITEPNKTTLYLVATTSPVYWDDTTAWSFTSGGAPSGCFPGRWTNVIIDDNSYVGNPAAFLELRPGLRNIGSKCHNFTSTRTAKTQYYSDRNNAYQSLYVYGSIDFNSTSELIPEHDGSPLYLMAETPQTLNINYFRGRLFFQGTGTGSWTLQRDLISDPAHNRVMYFRSGDLILNGYNLGTERLMEDASTKNYSIDMNNSDIIANQFLLPLGVLKNTENTNIYLTNRFHHAYFRSKQGANPYKFKKVFFDIINSTNSNGSYGTVQTDFAADTLLVRNSSTGGSVKFLILDTIDVKVFKTMRLAANTPAVRTLQMEMAGNYGSFYSDVPVVNINGNNYFDTLDIAQNSPVYTLAAGTTQTIKQAVYMSGSPCKFTTFRSATNGSLANLVVPRPMTVDFDIFAYINAESYDGTPGNILTAERNCTEEGGTFTQGITFINLPKTVIGLGEDLTACFKSFPYTISSAGFFAGSSATYEWRNSANQIISTTKDLVITVPGRYSLKVDYDPFYSCMQQDNAEILIALPISPVIAYDTLRPVCHKDSIVLTVNEPVGLNYKYAIQDTSNHGALTLQTSNIFTYVKAGVHYLVVDSLSCLSDSVLVEIAEPNRSAVANEIIINDTSTCPGTPITLIPQTEIGLNPIFRWYSDVDLTNEITVGVTSDGQFTTPILFTTSTYYVAVSNDTLCENLTTKGKPVTVSMINIDCLEANNDTAYVFACNSVVSDITANDNYKNEYTLNIGLNGGNPSKGNIQKEGITIKYINTSCVGGETDEYTYSLCEYVCDTATVKVYILQIPEIVLLDSCGFKPYMSLDIQLSTQQWQYSQDNSVGSWNDIAQCTNFDCFEVIPGFYRVKIQHLGLETYTKVKELNIQKTLIFGSSMWYKATLTAH